MEGSALEKKSFSPQNTSIPPQKKGVVETHQIEDLFSSPTPVKTKEPARIKSKGDLTKLPEKYGALLEFFERMTSSLRLLSLRKRVPTFQNISCQVEILTGRKLQFTHIAQMKYILPEAVQIDKILILDEKTKCMKPHMTIGLLLDVVKDHGEESIYVALSKLFSSRLSEFCIKHPEGCDVPEAALPEPFGQKTIAFKTEADSVSEDLSTSRETNLSHFAPSFEMNFSQKAAADEMEMTVASSPVKSAHAADEMEMTVASSPVKSAHEVIVQSNEEVEKVKSLSGSAFTVNMGEITPVKLLLASDSVVVETPVLCTPMRPISATRSVLTCEDGNKITGSQNSKQPTSTAKKALDFYGMDDQGPSFSHKQSAVRLSEFVFSIHRVFQSVNFCPITKEELVQKVMMNNLEFDDLRDVETQMEDLEKLVPDWFCKKLTRSGDLLYSVKKISDVNSVCERVNVI